MCQKVVRKMCKICQKVVRKMCKIYQKVVKKMCRMYQKVVRKMCKIYRIPLSAYQDFSAFKLYLFDVGLLSAMADVDAKTLLDGNEIFEEFKGSLAEQYVLCELKARTDLNVFYWSADTGTSELDFIVQIEKNNVPIEVKASENLQAKRLKTFAEKYNSKINVRTSMSDYRKENWLTNIPLYCIGNITTLV